MATFDFNSLMRSFGDALGFSATRPKQDEDNGGTLDVSLEK
jgi:hypothetical protein